MPANTIKGNNTSGATVPKDLTASEVIGLLNIPVVSGYDKIDPDSQPDLYFNSTTRTFSCSVKSGQATFHFWVLSQKVVKTTTQSVVIPNVTGTYYIVFDETGTLVSVSLDAVTHDDFYERAITGLIYWNATAQIGLVGDERHGILMDARTHHYNHSTFGSRYESGLNINGMVDGEPDYAETTSGYFWDEDIRHTPGLQSTHPFLYRMGVNGEWTPSTPDSNLGFMNSTSNVVFNEIVGGVWQLTESASQTDFMIYFFIATPDINGFPIKKIIGQNGYRSRATARDAIDGELSKLITEGLPSPEFVFLYAYIVRRNGDLEDLADGGVYVDLRNQKGGTSGSSGAGSNIAADIIFDPSGTDFVSTNLQSFGEEVDQAIKDIEIPPSSTGGMTACPVVETPSTITRDPVDAEIPELLYEYDENDDLDVVCTLTDGS